MGILKRKNQKMKINQLFLAIGLVSTNPIKEDSKGKILSRHRRFIDIGGLFGSAADWVSLQKQTEANAIARADQRETMAQTQIMISELAETRRGNKIAERANTLSDQANHLAKIANTIGEKGLHYQSEANEISNYANQLTKMDLEIAKKANDLTKEQKEQDYAIAMLTLDMEGRVAKMTEDLERELNQKLTNTLSDGFDDIVKSLDRVADAIDNGLDKLAEIITEQQYQWEINETKMIASNIVKHYTEKMDREEINQNMGKLLSEMAYQINDEKFNLRDFLHIAHTITEKMKDSDCDWEDVRDRGFAINSMFSVLKLTINEKSITQPLIPYFFEENKNDFFQSFAKFNLESSYRFERYCSREEVCFDTNFSKMPGNCLSDSKSMEENCDFSPTCEQNQAEFKESKITEANNRVEQCNEIKNVYKLNVDCDAVRPKILSPIDDLPDCFYGANYETEYSNWGQFSSCSQTCDDGTKTRERYCMKGSCDVNQMIETVSCNEATCTVYSNWGEWSTCSHTCDSGIKTRKRSCDQGYCHPNDLTHSETCFEAQCTTSTKAPVTQPATTQPTTSCNWSYYGGKYLNGPISGEQSYSSLSLAQQRCIQLNSRCNAVKQRGSSYQLVSNTWDSPQQSSAGTNTWVKGQCSTGNWIFWDNHYLNGSIYGESNHSTLSSAQNRCYQLGSRCNAVKYRGNGYELVSSSSNNPSPSSSGTDTWVKG